MSIRKLQLKLTMSQLLEYMVWIENKRLYE